MIFIKEFILIFIFSGIGSSQECGYDIPKEAYDELQGRKVMPGDEGYDASR